MSIIHDALKKVEISQQKEEPKPQGNNKGLPGRKPKPYLLFILAACAGLFVANIFYERLKTAATVKYKEPAPLPASILPPAETEAMAPELAIPPLALNGVFFSEDGVYALINNQIVRKGDKIEGATVIEISLEEVDLDFGGSVIKLLNTAK